MKLWLITAKPELEEDAYNRSGSVIKDNPFYPWYDKTFGMVIRAESEQAARTIAAGDSDNVWLNPDYTDCIELTAEGEAGIIIGDTRPA